MKNEEILTSALDQYSGPTGSVNWKRAFADNPTWKRTLLAGGNNMQAAVYTPANELKRRRAAAAQAPAQAPEPAAVLEAAQATPPATERDRIIELITQADAQYRVGKRINWQRAFAEHPDWLPILGKPTTRNYYLKALHNQRNYERKQTKAATRNGAPPPAAAVPLLCYCPRCGAHLEAVQIAMAALQEL